MFRISDRKGKKLINLIIFDNLKGGYHYALIKNFDRLLGSGDDHPKKFCPFCLHGFRKDCLKPGQLEEHKEKCFTYGGTRIVMPEEGKDDTLQIKDYCKQLEAPFGIYCDFEALTKKDENSEKGIKQIHEICGYSLCVKSPYQKDMRVSYRGKDAGYRFLTYIQCLSKELKKKIGDANAEMIYREK